MDGSCKCIKIKPKEDQALLRQDLLKWNIFTTITCGMETSIILKGHYRSSKTLAPTDFPKMLIYSLWCISVRLATGEKFMFTPCPPPTLTSLLSSPRANLTESVKKGSLLCWELPQGPQEWTYYSKFFSTKNHLCTPKSIVCSGGSFDLVQWLSISIYLMEEKWPIFLQNKRRNFSEGKSAREEINPSWSLFLPRYGSRCFILLIQIRYYILTSMPILMLTSTDTDHKIDYCKY